MTLPEFFNQLEEGEEFLSLLCTKDTYSLIPTNLPIVINSIRQKNESFAVDNTHKELVKSLRKAKKDLQDYEYEQNNK